MPPTAGDERQPYGQESRVAGWLDRPAGRVAPWLLVLLVLAAPAWLLRDRLQHFTIFGDDFAYVSDARNESRLVENLLKPRNTHIVPLFRIWTFALVKAAGRLSNLPSSLLFGAYLALVVTALLVGRLVTRATGSRLAGVVALSALCLSTVLEPVILWYSAGQALCAGGMVVASLLAAEGWLEHGGGWRLGLTMAGTVAAPMFWTGGLAAGPAVAAYLWLDRRRRGRPAAASCLALTACLAVALMVLVKSKIEQAAEFGGRHPSAVARGLEAVRSTAMAVPEILILRNLGVDATVTGLQGAVVCLAIAWLWSRGGLRRMNGLEAAGAVVFLCGFLMVFYFRGDMPYEDLRPVGWYYAIPHVGAVLFAAGWWARHAALVPTDKPAPLTRRELLAAAVVAAGLVGLQMPRAGRLFLESAPPMTAAEADIFKIPELQRLRAIYLADEHARRQARALARLERAEKVGMELGVGRETIRKIFGRLLVPGIPELQRESDAAELLDLPATDASRVDPMVVNAKLREFMTEEPVPPAPWLKTRETPGPKRAGAG
jgi:hypothetical protein